jgi:hypothetical protein
MLETISTWPATWQIGLATGAGVFAAALAYLVLRSLYPATGVDPDYLREHSILPEDVERSAEDSDPFSEGSITERRKAPRRRGNPVAVLLSDEDAACDPIEGYVVDRSIGGLGVELEESVDVEPGMVIAVRPRRDVGCASWTRVVVRNYEKVGSSGRLGCQFARPPDSQTMLHFG